MPEPGRDYMAEMNKRVDQILDDNQTYPAAVAAQQLHDWLEVNDPDLLDGWLRAYAVPILRDLFLMRNRRRRSTEARDHVKSKFTRAARMAEAGNPDALGFFRQRFVVNDKGDLKPVREMIFADWNFVATDYDQSARANKRKAAFARAVMKRIGPDQKTGDVYSEEELAALYERIVASDRRKAA